MIVVAGAVIAHAGGAWAGNNADAGPRVAVSAAPETFDLLPEAAPDDLGLSEADIRYFASQALASARSTPYVADASPRGATRKDSTPVDLPPSEAPLPEPISFAVLAVGLAGLYSLRRPKKR